MDPLSENMDVILQKAEALMHLPGVEGVAIGEKEGRPCLLVFNSLPAAHLSRHIPSPFEGLEVVYQDTSVIEAQAEDAPEA